MLMHLLLEINLVSVRKPESILKNGVISQAKQKRFAKEFINLLRIIINGLPTSQIKLKIWFNS